MSEEERCEHRVVASSCCVCHPEIAERVKRGFQCLTTPEIDATYAAYKSSNKGESD